LWVLSKTKRDTNGKERDSILMPYYREASGIILVYDVTNIDSFESITNYIYKIKEHGSSNVQLILVSNKVDLNNERQVCTLQGEMLAKAHGINFVETSAKNNEKIDDLFFTLTNQLKQNYEMKFVIIF
jgi:small GTP-binding protein